MNRESMIATRVVESMVGLKSARVKFELNYVLDDRMGFSCTFPCGGEAHAITTEEGMKKAFPELAKLVDEIAREEKTVIQRMDKVLASYGMEIVTKEHLNFVNLFNGTWIYNASYDLRNVGFPERELAEALRRVM